MPVLKVHSYKTSVAVLTGINISGPTQIPKSSSYDYIALGLFSSGAEIDLTAFTTFQMLQGGINGFINSSGHFTSYDVAVNGNVTFRATTVYQEDTFTDTHVVTVLAPADDQMANVLLLLNGDIVQTLETITLDAQQPIEGGTTRQLMCTGEFNTDVITNVNEFTTWEVITGQSYGTVDEYTGIFTAGTTPNLEGQLVVRATTTINGVVRQATQNLVIFVEGQDLYFPNVAVLLSGDIILAIVSNSVNNPGPILTETQVQFHASGLFNSGSTLNVDAYTTWDITVGGSFGSITSGGLFTAGSTPVTTGQLTIRATTVYDGVTVTATRDVILYQPGQDPYFSNVAFLVSGE